MKTHPLKRPYEPKPQTAPKVLLISSCSELEKNLGEILPTSSDLIVQSDPAAARRIVQTFPHIPIIAECSAKTSKSNALSLLLHGFASNNTVLLSDGGDEDNLRFMFEHPGLLNLLPRSFPDFQKQLKIILLKKFGGKPGLGVSPYLEKGSVIERLRLYSFSSHGTILMSLSQQLGVIKAYRSFKDRALTISTELMMNAVLDAHPEAGVRNHRRKLQSRNETIKLLKSEEVFVEFGYDDQCFAIATSDNHGLLKSRDAMQRLYRCSTLGGQQMRMTENRGAGIGFYMMYNWSSQVVFNLEPGKRTEVVCIIPIAKREKYALPPDKALNFFVKRSAR